MKTHKILILYALGLSMLSACQDDEVLNLEDFPLNKAEVIMQNADKLPAKHFLTYQQDGTLLLDGSLTRTYLFKFKPSPEPIVLDFSPIHTNIPADKVQLSENHVVINPGYTDAEVTVSLLDDDFSFAQSTLDSTVYELGVSASVNGFNIGESVSENKVVIEKEAYRVYASFNGPNQNTASFTKTIAGSEIEEKDPIQYKFSIVLDKPASQDVVFAVKTLGLSEEFENTVSVMPAEILIPAGQLSSGEVTWSVADDFLLQDSKPSVVHLDLNLSAVSDDKCVVSKGLNNISITINKKVVNVAVVDEPESDWKIIDKSSFEAVQVVSLNPVNFSFKCLFDGKTNNNDYVSGNIWSMPFKLGVDMKQNHTLKGVQLDYLNNYGQWASSKEVAILTSMDGDTWVEQSFMTGLSQGAKHVFKFYNPVEAQYVKFLITSVYGWSYAITEFTAFE